MLGLLRLLLIWRLVRLARPLIAVALVLTAVTLGAHALTGSPRQPHHHAHNPIGRLKHAGRPLRDRVEHALAAGLKPGDRR